jgi:hypothetical protein
MPNTLASVEVWMLCKGGTKLQGAILAANTTQRGLAAAIGRSHGLIGQLCSGSKTTCSPETAHLICAALRVPLDLLFWPESSNDSRQNDNEKLAERKHQVIPRSVVSRRGRSRGAKPGRAA